MYNSNGTVFVGALEKFNKVVTNNIRVGIFENKIVPFYKKEVIEEANSIDGNNYLITRGYDNDDQSYTKITLYKEIDGKVNFCLPTVKKIIEPLKISSNNAIPMIKQISWELEQNKNINMMKIYKEFHNEVAFGVMGSVPMDNTFGEIHLYILYSLIKQYMITEDIRYNKNNHLDRYLFLIATLDYLKNNVKIDDVLQRYGINS